MFKNHPRTLSILTLVVLFVGVGLGWQSVAQAYTAQQYASTQSLAVGTVVALDGGSQVSLASTATKNYLGVVVGQVDQKVTVANSGLVSVLVSDADGAVQSGDRLGVSNLAGTATLWRTGRSLVGVAKTAPENWQTVTVNGNQSVRIGSVAVQLVADSTTTTPQTNSLMATLQSVAQGVAGKSVDTWRIVTALLLGVGGLILSFGLLFISSRESFFSLGRNPMAEGVILHGLWKMIIVAVLVLFASLAAAYLIVRVG